MNILFVCTGNTCRSCMAEAIAKNEAKRLGLDIKVSSAGIFAFKGAPASENAVKAMNEMELDLSCHTASPLSQDVMDKSYIILTMTGGHKNTIVSSYPALKDKVFTLKEYVGETGDISDPFGGDINIYRECAAELKRLIDKLFSKLKES